MSNTHYSMDTALSEMIRLSKNALAVINSYSDAITSTSPQVSFTVDLGSGVTQTSQIYSWSWVQNNVNRLDSNFRALSGVDGGEANVRLSDGTLQKIILNRTPKEPSKISSIGVPTSFGVKSNWFFESFLNPLLYVSFPLSGQIPDSSERIRVKRMLLNLDTDTKISFWNTNLLNQTNLDFSSTVSNLTKQGITWFEDEEVINLPEIQIRNKGHFDLINIIEEDVTVTIAGVSQLVKKKKWILNRLTYTDVTLPSLNNTQLKIGDILLVGTSSRWIITDLNFDESWVTIENQSGWEVPVIGASIFEIEPGALNSGSVDVNVGFNETFLIFFKSIDPTFEIVASEWSVGVGIDTNALLIDTPTGHFSLSDYYKNNVLDLGKYFLGLAKERPIASLEAIKPNAPALIATDIKVVKVNTHKDDTTTLDSIRQKQAEKTKTQSEIDKLDTAIVAKKLALNESTTDTQRAQLISDLDQLTREKTSKSAYYSTLVQDLVTTSSSLGGSLSAPEYHAQGFFQIPAAQIDSNGISQEVIGFELEYRKLSNNNNPKNPESLPFTSSGTTTQAFMSPWVLIPPVYRKKVYDSVSGTYKWADEDPKNPDTNNVNQIDIEISSDEKVEIRVRSISEAGYPTNPAISDWSTSVIVEFPSNLPVANDAKFILEEAQKEDIRLQFETTLAAKGLDQHLETQFVSNDKFYAHQPEDISSGFRTSNDKIINLYDQLKSNADDISTLKQSLVGTTAGLQVSILITENGQVRKQIINNGDTVKLFAGYYLNQYPDAATNPINAGKIAQNQWTILVENISSNTLEMVAPFTDSVLQRPLFAFTNANRQSVERYRIAPIMLPTVQNGSISTWWPNGEWKNLTTDIISSNVTNLSTVDESLFNPVNTFGISYANPFPFLSSQVANQWIYCRSQTLDGRTIFESLDDIDTGSITLPQKRGSVYSAPSLSGAFNTYSTSLSAVSPTQPEVGAWTIYVNGGTGSLPTSDPVWNSFASRGFNTTDSVTDIITGFSSTNSDWVNQSGLVVRSTLPLPAYVVTSNKPSATPTITNWGFYMNRIWSGNNYSGALQVGDLLPMKGAFTKDDEYLAGQLTCRDYLFIAPSDYNTLQVPGTFSFVTKKIIKGEDNAIRIPVVYQWRTVDKVSPSKVGGFDNASSLTNYPLTKKLGIDLFYKNLGQTEAFQFDIEVSSDHRQVRSS